MPVERYEPTKQDKYRTVRDTARILGITRRRVTALIKAGRLPATKFSGVWAISESAIEKVKNRKPGRPKIRN